jgi:RNA polymerase sigma-70 factor (ECF subfamily)
MTATYSPISAGPTTRVAGRQFAESGPRQRRLPGGIVRDVDGADSLLVARMVAGDEEALAEVWQRHGSLVFGLARRVTGDVCIAEEVAQEVFVALWQHPDRFDPARGSLRAYLGVHAHRRAIDALRRDGRRAAREERSYQLDGSTRCRSGDEAGADVAAVVREAIGRLPAEQRQAVVLAYYHGLTHIEVADALGVPEGTAKSRLRLAHAKLCAWLDRTLLEPV